MSDATPPPTANLDKPRSVLLHVRFFLGLPPKKIGELLKETYRQWYADNAPRLGAALAYYTVFSLAPLLVVVIAVAGLAFGPEAAKGQVLWQIDDMIGPGAAEVVQIMLRAAWSPGQGILATLMSFIVLIIGASLVVSELRSSLNIVWDVPESGTEQSVIADIIDFVQQRLYAFFLVLGIGFLLLVSLIANAMLAVLGKYFQTWLPTPEFVLQVLNFIVGSIVTAFVFGLIYKVVPDVSVAWSDVVIGAAMTSLLFTVGKLLIALYLGKSGLGSAYGAAGSLMVLLAWVYYSAQVFFLGAEFTQVYANTYGSRFVARRRY